MIGLILIFFAVFSAKLAAGGVDIAAQRPPHRGRDAAFGENLLKPGHRLPGAGLQRAFLHMVQRNQIKVGGQPLSLTPSIMAYSKEIRREVAA